MIRILRPCDPYLISRLPRAIAWDNDHGKGRLAAYTALLLDAGRALDGRANPPAPLIDRARYLAALAEAAEALDERIFEHRHALETELRRRVLALLPEAREAVAACAGEAPDGETLAAAALCVFARLKALQLHLLDEERHLPEALRDAALLQGCRPAEEESAEADAALGQMCEACCAFAQGEV